MTSSSTFIVQYYDYYGQLITTGVSSPTISTIIPSIKYSATYFAIATLLSESISTSINPTRTITLSALIDTASTTELQIVILPTVSFSGPSTTTSSTQPSQTTQLASPTSSSATEVHEKSRSLSSGAISGIVIGVAFAVIALLALVWWIRRRQRRRIRPSTVPSQRTISRGFEKAELETPTRKEAKPQTRHELPDSGEMKVEDSSGGVRTTKLD